MTLLLEYNPECFQLNFLLLSFNTCGMKSEMPSKYLIDQIGLADSPTTEHSNKFRIGRIISPTKLAYFLDTANHMILLISLLILYHKF